MPILSLIPNSRGMEITISLLIRMSVGMFRFEWLIFVNFFLC